MVGTNRQIDPWPRDPLVACLLLIVIRLSHIHFVVINNSNRQKDTMKFSSIAVTAILFATKAEAFAGPQMKPRFALQVRRRRRRLFVLSVSVAGVWHHPRERKSLLFFLFFQEMIFCMTVFDGLTELVLTSFFLSF